MSKRRELAIAGAIVCAAAAGVVIGRGIGKHIRPPPARAPKPRPLVFVPPLALPPARERHHAVAISLDEATPSPPRRATYETVRIGPATIRRRAIAVTGAGALLTAAILVGVAVANPQVTALAAPSVAYPGTIAVVAYAAAGFGSFSYGLDAPSRRHAGVLAARQGDLQVPVTQRDVNADIIVIVRAAGPFGSDARVARIRVLPRPRAVVKRLPSNGVTIDAIGLDAATVAGGSEIAVRYRSNATSGTVALRDVRGGTWQSKPLSATGFTRLRAPLRDRDTPFSVVVQARRNGTSIENSVALVVTGSATAAPRGESQPPPAAVTREIPAVAQSGAVLVTSAGAGKIATVVELTGADGTALQRATPRADGTTELRMPVVTAPQSYLISVSYQNGAGREASFHSIRVLPPKR